MLRNYNGNVNRQTLRDLQKLCEVNEQNFQTLMNSYTEKGEVSFYANLDPMTGCPDEMSEIVTLKSEDEIKTYLKKDFQERVDGYLREKRPAEDYLLNLLVDFIKENDAVFPSRDKMRQLEITAENARVAARLGEDKDSKTLDMKEKIAEEILELSEEIMEIRREINPKEIIVHVEPYMDEFTLSNNNFHINIEWARYYGRGDNTDYRVEAYIREDSVSIIDKIRFGYYYDGSAYYQAEDYFEDDITDEIDEDAQNAINDNLISIHRFLCEVAEKEGFEFLSEVDYEKLSA